jgi:methionyl-tRNA synthetase
MFRRHLEAGYIYKDSQQQLYDAKANRFLPDRYVEGRCPFCDSDEARGDQCDQCGRTYEAVELKQPRSRISGNTDLEIRETEHYFLDLSKLQEPLLAWLKDGKTHWRPNVIHFARTQVEQIKLRGRPITRDMDWGVSIPLPDTENKCIYVWYDAVIGYFSATIEWAQLNKTSEQWRQWWDAKTNPDARIYNFIGKDNIPFHAMMWPAMLIAYRDMNLPYDVPANEFLNMYGRKFSKSQGRIISILDVLKRYQADAWRYALTAIAPETSDVDFSWDDFVERVNNELVANWGNLVNRVLGFAYKRWDGVIPTPGPLSEQDRSLLDEVKAGFQSVGELYERVKLKAAMNEVRRLSQRANQYLHDAAPWSTIKTDPHQAATSIYVALQVIDWLKILWAPILPHSSQQLHELLGYDGQLFGRQYTETVKDARGEHLVLRYDNSAAIGTWEPGRLNPGQALKPPKALFVKLDEDVAEKETEAASN